MTTEKYESSVSGVSESGDSWTLTVAQEIHQMETLGGGGYHNEPDPDWVKVDEWGHTHTAERKLLRWHVTYSGPDVDGCCEIEEGEYRCVWCGETIEPGMRRVLDRPVQGLRRMTLQMSRRLAAPDSRDSGVWFLTRAEQESLTWTDQGLTPAWLVEVTNREPDSRQIMFGSFT
jgi:hypothetical protein